jgi:hypothetical protein
MPYSLENPKLRQSSDALPPLNQENFILMIFAVKAENQKGVQFESPLCRCVIMSLRLML